VLEDAAGKTSLHQQLSADCMAFLSEFMKHERAGVATFLTFKAPPVAHGKVLAVYCIRCRLDGPLTWTIDAGTEQKYPVLLEYAKAVCQRRNYPLPLKRDATSSLSAQAHAIIR